MILHKMVSKLKVCSDPLACKEQYKFQTTTDFILKTRLFVSEQQGVWKSKGVYFHKLGSDFQRLSLYLTQGTVRIAKDLCKLLIFVLLLFRSLRFGFLSKFII